jgi:hypothetical protein
MASIQEISSALRSIATPGMKPKEIRAAIRERYPDVTKKEIVRAAFYALADASTPSDEELVDLHQFALSERGTDDASDPTLSGSARKKGGQTDRQRPEARNAMRTVHRAREAK